MDLRFTMDLRSYRLFHCTYSLYPSFLYPAFTGECRIERKQAFFLLENRLSNALNIKQIMGLFMLRHIKRNEVKVLSADIFLKYSAYSVKDLKIPLHCVQRAPVREVKSRVYVSAYCLNPQNTMHFTRFSLFKLYVALRR